MTFSLILLLLVSFCIICSAKEYKRVCYHTYWSETRNGMGRYNLQNDYEVGLCTHVIYSFAQVKFDTANENPYISSYEAAEGSVANTHIAGYQRVSSI